MLLACYGAFLLYRLHHNPDNNFDLGDVILNEQTRRADPSKITVLAFAVLSIWTVVTLVQRDKPVETLLLGVLGVFVGARVLNNIFGKVPPDPPKDA
jgi:hypothetical protein